MNTFEPEWHTKSKAKLVNKPHFMLKELFTNNSLTKRISGACGGAFSVKVLEQKTNRIFLSESLKLGIRHNSMANVRHVLLFCQNTPVIFARTILPFVHMKRSVLRLIKLGNKSLGSVLYSERTTIKYETEIALFTQQHFLFNYIKNNNTAALPQEILGRRNVYDLNGQKILLNEIYLPPYWQKIGKH